MKQLPPLLAALSLLTIAPFAAAEIPPIPRVLPPEGIEIPSDVEARLEAKGRELDTVAVDGELRSLLPDVEVFQKAVRLAVLHREFYTPKDFDKADWALAQAEERLQALAKGDSPWTTATGLIVRGYRSSIDGSAQPYGLVIPKDHDFARPCPLFVWLHGRGDKATDLHFLHERATKVGQIAPPGAIVVHPFGRQCVGYKSAGEVDVLEVVSQVQRQYKIDPRRIVLIGFSMGGAGAWHLGAHYADRWVAVSPGAGFAETARYQRLSPDKYPSEYERKLWGQYDVPAYVRNLFNTEVIAYSGELDKQIQAARVMEEAFRGEGRELTHLIGPGVEHKYEPKTLEELLARLKKIVETPIRDPFREARDWVREVHLQTRTLAYHRQDWVSAEGLQEHWRDARIDGKRTRDKIEVTTKNISRMKIDLRDKDPMERELTVDGQTLGVPRIGGARSILVKQGGAWKWEWIEGTAPPAPPLRKEPGLQGPIDDAFRSRFVVVAPSGKSKNARFQEWTDFELAHFIGRWRSLMRAELPLWTDTDVTEEVLSEAGNLILFGDSDSNSVIARLIEQTTMRFADGKWTHGNVSLDGNRFVPAMIYPKKSGRGYIVLNSGLTFREGHDRTNSLQNPKLPDWAIIDITQPPDAFAPGRIHDADFFDESWQLKRAPKAP